MGVIFFPPRRRLQLAFAQTIALAFQNGHVGVVNQAVEQSAEASGVGEDLIPFLVGLVGGDDQRFSASHGPG